MAFYISVRLGYTVQQRSAMLLNIHAAETQNQVLSNEEFTLTNGVECEFCFSEQGENRIVRIDTCDVSELMVTYNVAVDINPNTRDAGEIIRTPITLLDRSALSYLYPSRYCQSDRFGLMAAKLFGNYEQPIAQVTAITEWIYENIDYVSGSTDAATSAYETVTQRSGVCRDFAHLGIAFCRALSIPARYFSGYACNMQPPDFHACFEVYLGGQWFVFDPTRLSALDGLIRIGGGRDAADTSIATIFGPMQLGSMEVSCTADQFNPMETDELFGRAVLLEP